MATSKVVSRWNLPKKLERGQLIRGESDKHADIRSLLLVQTLRRHRVVGAEPSVRAGVPTATGYDVDVEHAYIMAWALNAYRQHQTPPPVKLGTPRRRLITVAAIPGAGPQRHALQNTPTKRTPKQDLPISGCTPNGDATSPVLIRALLARQKPSPSTNQDALLRHRRRIQSARLYRERASDRPLPQPPPPSCPGSPAGSPVVKEDPKPETSLATADEPELDPISEVGRANGLVVNFIPKAPIPGQSRSPKKTTVPLQPGRSSAKEDHSYKRQYKADAGLFSAVRTPRKQCYTIHPEWVSESMTISRVSLAERQGIVPPRRCKSAPPPRSRNPITWERFEPERTRTMVRSMPPPRTRNPITWEFS